MDMPQDVAMLLSVVNTKLRDGAPSPEELCAELGWDCSALYSRLGAAGFVYDGERNCFR